MEITQLIERPNIHSFKKLAQSYDGFCKLLDELRRKELPDTMIEIINKQVEDLNSIPTSEKVFKKQIINKRTIIIKLLAKELKIVPVNYYRNLWMAIGMAGFGIPMGVAFATAIGNMAFLGIGIPIGLALGIALGSEMDRKALNEGRQLKI